LLKSAVTRRRPALILPDNAASLLRVFRAWRRRRRGTPHRERPRHRAEGRTVRCSLACCASGPEFRRDPDSRHR